MRLGRTMNIKRSIGKRVAAAIVAGTVMLMMIGVLYLSFLSQMAGYNGYLACNPRTGISRIEWFVGIRPVENECWR
jgi:hypothetical protein